MVKTFWFDKAKLRLLHIVPTACQGLTNFFGKLVLKIKELLVWITNFFGRITNGNLPFVARIPVNPFVF
jgi:hypothetical protein